MADRLSEYRKAIGSVLGLDEDSEYLPESMKLLKSHMEGALQEGGSRYDSVRSPESDQYRHVMGMRRSALDPEVGGIAAFFGGLGHEVNNLSNALIGKDLSQLGTQSSRLGLMQILRNSSDDVVNNFIGVLSAYQNPEELTDEELLLLLESARLPEDIRRPDESAVMIDQGANLNNGN